MNAFTQEQVEEFCQRLEQIAEHQSSAVAILAADRTARDLDAIRYRPGRRSRAIRRMTRWVSSLGSNTPQDQPIAEPAQQADKVVIIDATYRVIDSGEDGPPIVTVEVQL